MKTKFGFLMMMATAAYSILTYAGVENVLSMQREATGYFSVMCDNKGVVSHASGVTADAIRTDQVCVGDVGVGSLEEGFYKTETDFCSQTVKWNGAQLSLILAPPCSGTVVLEPFQGNWYRGKLVGYEYIYEAQVLGPQKYVFYSRDFGTEGEFMKATASSSPSFKFKKNIDPARN